MIVSRYAGHPLIEDVVVDLVENPRRTITRRDIGHLGEVGDTLLRWGALQPGETLTSVACSSCGDDHIVDLEFDRAVEQWRYYCGSVGFVPVHRDEVVTYRFDLSWLTAQLGQLLGIRRLEQACLIDDVIWRLGTARLDQRFWTAILVRDVHLHLDAILHRLQLTGRGNPGLVLVSGKNVPQRVVLPNDYRWLPLRQLPNAETGQLEVHEAAIRDPLCFRKRRQGGKAKPGRPGVAEHVLPELRRRAAAGEMHGTLAAEARHLSAWLAQSPRSISCEPRSMETAIRGAYWELKVNPQRNMK